jgi:hypothetical protein
MSELTKDAEPHVMRAFIAFREVLETGMQPMLDSSVQNGNWRNGEYDIVIRGNHVYGTTHEEIAALLDIATRHGGRLWLHRESGELCILFPYERPLGPVGSSGEEAPPEAARRRSRGGKKVKVEETLA